MLIALPHSGHLISFISELKRLTNYSFFLSVLAKTSKNYVKPNNQLEIKFQINTGYLEKIEKKFNIFLMMGKLQGKHNNLH